MKKKRAPITRVRDRDTYLWMYAPNTGMWVRVADGLALTEQQLIVQYGPVKEQ